MPCKDVLSEPCQPSATERPCSRAEVMLVDLSDMGEFIAAVQNRFAAQLVVNSPAELRLQGFSQHPLV